MDIEQFIKAPKPCRIDRPIYGRNPHGWYATNSVIIRDCVPIYRNSGGGVSDDRLTDLPTAIKQCVIYLTHRIREAEKLKSQLTDLLESDKCLK